MRRLRRSLLTWAGLGTGLLVFGAQLGLLREAQGQARREWADLHRKEQERGWLARQVPAPSEENAVAITHDLERAEQVLAGLRAMLGAGREAPAEAGSDRIAAYFEIAAFVERMQGLATDLQVAVQPENRFGFSSYAREGPAGEWLPAVSRQRRAAEQVVTLLLEARPRELLRVQRERPRLVPAKAGRVPPGMGRADEPAMAVAEGPGDDFFEWAPAGPSPCAGGLESSALRLEFSGQTPALRAFLNRLAAAQVPVIVRRIEVEPMPVERGAPGGDGPMTPLVEAGVSRFVVVVEVIGWVDGSGGTES